MPLSGLYENSATISTTEYSLPNNANFNSANVKTDDAVVQAFIDMTAMAAGDEYELKVYEKVRGTSTAKDYFGPARIVGPQSAPLRLDVGIVLHGWDITLRKITGTDRSIEWSVRAATP